MTFVRRCHTPGDCRAEPVFVRASRSSIKASQSCRSSGQSASPHVQTRSRTVRPVLRSSRVCARRSGAPQRRQHGSLRLIGAVCGPTTLLEDVRESMALRPANDCEVQRCDRTAMQPQGAPQHEAPLPAIRAAPGMRLSAAIRAEAKRRFVARRANRWSFRVAAAALRNQMACAENRIS